MRRGVVCLDFEGYQLFTRPLGLAALQCVLADKVALLKFDKAVKHGLERIELGQKIGFPVQEAFLKPH